MILKPEYDDFLGAIDELVTSDPFAVMACNYISNVSINSYSDREDVLDGTDRWRQGYRFLDRCVGDIIALLKRKGQLENTCVILYGDHGDDFWAHGMHGGLTHAVEPLATLIHTPLMILDPDTNKGLDERLLCATDLKGIICAKLGIGEVAEPAGNTYVTARSSYAAQPVRKETFNKAYAMTDGRFLMLVSANGLEMYDIEMDFQCGFNFLEVFRIDRNLICYNTEKNENLKFHYRDFMNDREITKLRQTAYYFRRKLYEETLRLYQAAGRTERDMNGEMHFDKIHYQYG